MAELCKYGVLDTEFRVVFNDKESEGVWSIPLQTYIDFPDDYPKPDTIGVYYTDEEDGLQYFLDEIDQGVFKDLIKYIIQ